MAANPGFKSRVAFQFSFQACSTRIGLAGGREGKASQGGCRARWKGQKLGHPENARGQHPKIWSATTVLFSGPCAGIEGRGRGNLKTKSQKASWAAKGGIAVCLVHMTMCLGPFFVD